MTDFPPDLRDRWLKLVEREPKLMPEHLERIKMRSWVPGEAYFDGWMLHGRAIPAEPTAAALCRDAMRDLLERIGTLNTHYSAEGQACAALSEAFDEIASAVAPTMLAALIAVSETVLNAKEKSDR